MKITSKATRPVIASGASKGPAMLRMSWIGPIGALRTTTGTGASSGSGSSGAAAFGTGAGAGVAPSVVFSTSSRSDISIDAARATTPSLPADCAKSCSFVFRLN